MFTRFLFVYSLLGSPLDFDDWKWTGNSTKVFILMHTCEEAAEGAQREKITNFDI